MANSLIADTMGVKNRFIQALLEEGLNASPIQSWTQGASRLAHALLGGLELRDAERSDREAPAEILRLLGAAGGAQPTAPTAPTTPPPSAPPSVAPTPPRIPSVAAASPAPPPTPPVGGGGAFGGIRGWSPGERPIDMPPIPPVASSFNDRFAAASPAPVQDDMQPAPPPAAPPVPPQVQVAQAQAAQQPGRPQIPPHVAQMINHPNPNVRRYGVSLLQQFIKPQQLKSVVVGDKAFVFDERTGRYTPGPDATKATDDERNLASENKSRAAQGLPPLSMVDFKRATAAAAASGKDQGEAQSSLPAAESRAQRALKGIQELREHQGRLHGPSSYAAPYLPGTAAYDFKKRVDQLKGGAFLEAFQMLRGGGQITQIEGQKAQDAVERLDRALSKEDFDAALKDFEDAVRDGVVKLKLKASGDARASGSAGGVRRYNPATGRIE